MHGRGGSLPLSARIAVGEATARAQRELSESVPTPMASANCEVAPKMLALSCCPGGHARTEWKSANFTMSSRKPGNPRLNCPHCHQSAEYDLGWLVRTKRRNLPPRADERDRARFAKARSYMVRRDDLVACKNPRCRKRFEVSGVAVGRVPG